MEKIWRTARLPYLGVVLVATALTGCSTGSALIFAQSHTVGISVASNLQNQGIEASLGFDEQSLAIVPVIDNGISVAEVSAENADENFYNPRLIAASSPLITKNSSGELVAVGGGEHSYDAMSVFGAFALGAGGGARATVPNQTAVETPTEGENATPGNGAATGNFRANLGSFFATGIAAQNLSRDFPGFGTASEKPNVPTCGDKPGQDACSENPDASGTPPTG